VLGRKVGYIHLAGLGWKMLDPENLIDIKIEIPENPSSQALSTGSFENSFITLRGDHDNRLEVLDIRLVQCQVYDPQAPGAGPLADRFGCFVIPSLQAVCSVVINQSSISLGGNNSPNPDKLELKFQFNFYLEDHEEKKGNTNSSYSSCSSW